MRSPKELRVGIRPGKLMYILLTCLSLALVPGSACFGIEINPLDLPPSPFSLPASTEPQSARLLRDAEGALKIHAASTNSAVQKALGELRIMKDQLVALEKAAWEKDPLLLVCDQYIEKAHEWAMNTHGTEIQDSMNFFYSTNDAATVQSRRRLENQVTRMVELILFHELNRNTNFGVLQRSVYEIGERFYRENGKASSNRGDLCRYWYFDRYIGLPVTNTPPAADCTLTNLQAQIGRRYDLLVAGLTKIQREKNIPADAVTGLKYGLIYRSVDGMCEFYLEVRTPAEIQKLREEMRRKLVDLSWLEKRSN